MSQLNLVKPVILVMYGYPGSGRTFCARQLAVDLKAAHLQADRIRFELFEEPRYDKQESDLIGRLMEYMSEEFIEAGMSVIWDGNSERIAQRRLIKNLAAKLKCEVVTVWPQIDIESAYARVEKRDHRKLDDKFAQSLERVVFDQMLAEMQNPGHNENYVVISGKHNYQTQKNAVSKKLFDLQLLPTESQSSTVMPGLVNRIPNTMGGRVDQDRRNISIR